MVTLVLKNSTWDKMDLAANGDIIPTDPTKVMLKTQPVMNL